MKKTTGYVAVIQAGLLAAGLVISAGVAQGAIINFTGGGTNQNWQNAQNWDGPVPTVGDTARIQNDLTAQVAAQDQAADEVHVVYGTPAADGRLIIRAGRTLTVDVMSVGHNGAGTGTLSQGLVVAGDLQLGHLTSGVTRVGATAGQTTLIGVYDHLAGTHQTDTLLIGAQHASFTGARSRGTYNVLGASATLNAGNVILGEAADDRKTGRLNIDAYGANIQFGEFTQMAFGTLSFTAEANGFSTINVTGTEDAVALAGTLLVDLALYEGSASEIILISNAGSDAISGTFDNVTLMNNTQGYSLTYTGGDGNDLALIPEPKAIFLISLVGVVVLFGRRFFTVKAN